MFEKNQFNLWPNWRKGPFPPENQKLSEVEKTDSEKTDSEKATEKINGIIQDIYRKIDEAKGRQPVKERIEDDDSEKLPSEREEIAKINYRDPKSRQYKD